MKDGTIRKISVIQTWIWILLLLPISAVFYMMGVATIMMLDNGAADQVKLALIIASCGLFWVTPALVISSVAAGFFFRKKGKLTLSVAIQLAPIASALLAFLLLAVSF